MGGLVTEDYKDLATPQTAPRVEQIGSWTTAGLHLT